MTSLTALSFKVQVVRQWCQLYIFNSGDFLKLLFSIISLLLQHIIYEQHSKGGIQSEYRAGTFSKMFKKNIT